MTFTADLSQNTTRERIAKGRYTDDRPPKINTQVVVCECVAFSGENGAYTIFHCSRHDWFTPIDPLPHERAM